MASGSCGEADSSRLPAPNSSISSRRRPALEAAGRRAEGDDRRKPLRELDGRLEARLAAPAVAHLPLAPRRTSPSPRSGPPAG